MNLTFKIAIYGAVLSTVTAVMQIFNYRRDRANIKIIVTDKKDELRAGTSVYDDTMETYICIDVVNKGRRPIVINGGFLKFPNTTIDLKFSSGYRTKPVKLSEGEYETYLIPEKEITRYGFTKKDLILAAIDAEGKNHWSDNLIMRWIKIRRCRSKITKGERL